MAYVLPVPFDLQLKINDMVKIEISKREVMKELRTYSRQYWEYLDSHMYQDEDYLNANDLFDKTDVDIDPEEYMSSEDHSDYPILPHEWMLGLRCGDWNAPYVQSWMAELEF